MTPAWLLYALLVSSMLAAGAWCAERALRLFGRPARHAWLPAMGASLLVPALAYAGAVWFPEVGVRMASLRLPDPALTPVLRAALEGTSGDGGTRGAPGWLATGWLALSACVLGGIGIARLRLARECAGWRRARVAGADVLWSPATGPATVGALRPRIVLPEWMHDLPAARLELVLLHELEHVRARDGLYAVVGLALAALAPWNPFMWWMLARLHLAQEMDCDASLVAGGVPVRGYVELLVTAAAAGRPGLAPLGLSLHHPTLLHHQTLRRRVLQMTREPRRGSKFLATVSAACAVAAASLACDARVPAVTGPGPDGTPAAIPNGVSNGDGTSMLALELSANALGLALVRWNQSNGETPSWSEDGRWIKVRSAPEGSAGDWILEAESRLLWTLVASKPSQGVDGSRE